MASAMAAHSSLLGSAPVGLCAAGWRITTAFGGNFARLASMPVTFSSVKQQNPGARFLWAGLPWWRWRFLGDVVAGPLVIVQAGGAPGAEATPTAGVLSEASMDAWLEAIPVGQHPAPWLEADACAIVGMWPTVPAGANAVVRAKMATTYYCL